MGAWGYGPFDSDGSLDFLGDLADNFVKDYASCEDIDPANVDTANLIAELTAVLGKVADADHYGNWDVYATAGLIAAAAAGDAFRGEPSGTRLLATIHATVTGTQDPDVHDLGLGNHCGFVGLLTAEQAKELLPLAVTAVAALRATSWKNDFVDPAAIETQLERLESILAGPILAD